MHSLKGEDTPWDGVIQADLLSNAIFQRFSRNDTAENSCNLGERSRITRGRENF